MNTNKQTSKTPNISTLSKKTNYDSTRLNQTLRTIEVRQIFHDKNIKSLHQLNQLKLTHIVISHIINS